PTQGVEWESTNPVVFDPSATLSPRRRAPLEAPLGEEPADAPIVADSGATASPSAPPPVSDAEEQPVEVAAALEAFQLQAPPLDANAILEQSDDEGEAAVACIRPV